VKSLAFAIILSYEWFIKHYKKGAKKNLTYFYFIISVALWCNLKILCFSRVFCEITILGKKLKNIPFICYLLSFECYRCCKQRESQLKRLKKNFWKIHFTERNSLETIKEIFVYSIYLKRVKIERHITDQLPCQYRQVDMRKICVYQRYIHTRGCTMADLTLNSQRPAKYKNICNRRLHG
jgi:hypothetical protein